MRERFRQYREWGTKRFQCLFAFGVVPFLPNMTVTIQFHDQQEGVGNARSNGFEPCAGHVLDWVFTRGMRCAGEAELPARHDARVGANLSDHRPVLATVAGPER